MQRRHLPFLLTVTAAALFTAVLWTLQFRQPAGLPLASLPLPPGGLTPLDLPPPRSSGVEELRPLQTPGKDRFLLEATEVELEKRIEELIPFLLAPPREAGELPARFQGIPELVEAEFPEPSLAPEREKPLRRGSGVEAWSGEFSKLSGAGSPATGGPRGPLALAAAVRRLISPLDALDAASIKIVGIEGGAGGSFDSEAIYELSGGDPGGERRQWNGRWRLRWSGARRLARIEPIEATRVILSGKAFEDVTSWSLASVPAWREQLRPSLDFFRERIDAATGIDVYGHHGVAVGDLDGDGIEDLYLPEAPGLPARLLRGRGDGAFEDRSAGSGADLLDGASQALILDLDNDGDQDLFIAGERGVVVLLNDGQGKFTPRPQSLEKLRSARSTIFAAAAADYDGDGLVDIYAGAYVFWRGAPSQLGSRLPFPYHDAHNGAPNFLLKNLGGGKFKDVTEEAGLSAGNDRFTFAAAWGDFDDDGRPDLAVANDFGAKNLYRNRGDGTFVEVTGPAGAADLGAGMSVAWEDYDNDGRLDLYFGNMFSTAGLRVTGRVAAGAPGGGELPSGDEPPIDLLRKHARGSTLLKNRGDGTFEDVSLAARAYLGRWAWSSDFLDFDLDGREDLFIANGFVTGVDSLSPGGAPPDL